MLASLIFIAGQLVASAPGFALAVPAPAAGQTVDAPLTLSAAVARARQSSPRRRGAAILAEASRDAARVSGRLPNPVVDFRTENWGPASAAPGLDVFAEVTQPIELGGKRRLRQQVAGAEHLVTGAAVQVLERALALETVRAYLRALRAKTLLDTLVGNRDGLGVLVVSATHRVEDGYTAEADLLKFKTEAARVEGDIARARLELERSLSALGAVIGSEAPIEPGQLVDPPALPVPTPDARDIAAAVLRHPDVMAAAAGVERAHVNTAYERARRVPDAAVTAGYKRTDGFDTGVVGMSVVVPLFDRNDAAIARAAGAESSAAADREALVRQLTIDATSMLRAAQTMTAQAARSDRDLLEPAEGVRRAARAAFREGTADVLKLIDAERVYADVHRAAIDLRLDALLTTIEARFALGEETIP